MITISATEARGSFLELIERANQQHEVFKIKHEAGNLVMMSAEDYVGLQKTLHLLSKKNENEVDSSKTKIVGQSFFEHL